MEARDADAARGGLEGRACMPVKVCHRRRDSREMDRRRALAGSIANKVFNIGIVKISATTEITKFREIRPKFRRIFFRD